jgi:LPXTG-motif cell wall-anchored protein
VKHHSAAIVSALAVLGMALIAPTMAFAQITTFVAPPRKAVDSAKQAIVAEQRARTDSAAHLTLTDMKAWVDSAAGVGVDSSSKVVVTDTVAAAVPADVRSSPSGSTTTFSNGAIAPNTASPLPTLFVGGLLAVVLGAFLLSLKRRRA